MSQIQNIKIYDLEKRTFEFAKRIIKLSKALPNNSENRILSNQLVRSGTSIGANYREANETSTKKDFLFRMRICRKEAKETIYWLYLIKEINSDFSKRMGPITREAEELVKIIASIIVKSS